MNPLRVIIKAVQGYFETNLADPQLHKQPLKKRIFGKITIFRLSPQNKPFFLFTALLKNGKI